MQRHSSLLFCPICPAPASRCAPNPPRCRRRNSLQRGLRSRLPNERDHQRHQPTDQTGGQTAPPAATARPTALCTAGRDAPRAGRPDHRRSLPHLFHHRSLPQTRSRTLRRGSSGPAPSTWYPPAILDKISETVSPQSIAAVIRHTGVAPAFRRRASLSSWTACRIPRQRRHPPAHGRRRRRLTRSCSRPVASTRSTAKSCARPWARTSASQFASLRTWEAVWAALPQPASPSIWRAHRPALLYDEVDWSRTVGGGAPAARRTARVHRCGNGPKPWRFPWTPPPNRSTLPPPAPAHSLRGRAAAQEHTVGAPSQAVPAPAFRCVFPGRREQGFDNHLGAGYTDFHCGGASTASRRTGECMDLDKPGSGIFWSVCSSAG